MLCLWADLKARSDTSAMSAEEGTERRDRLYAAVCESSVAVLAGRFVEHVAGRHTLTCLDVCHSLEQSTPLLLLHLIVRKGSRNRLDSGLQQTYGDHTRMLAFAIDRMAAGDTSWLADRVWKGVVMPEHTISRCIQDFLDLALDRGQQLALWLAASLHDYGKLHGRRSGLDPEDGVVLVEQLLARVEPVQDFLALVLFAVRNHDVIESVTTGEAPPSFISEQLDTLPAGQRRLALALVGVIQLAGAASLGTGRIVPSKVAIYDKCLDASITAEVPTADRARALCSAVDRGEHHFATLAVDDRQAIIRDEQARDLLGRIVLHGWDDLRDEAWAKYGDQAFPVLNGALEVLARASASAGMPIRHLVIDGTARSRLLADADAAARYLTVLQDRALNGEYYLTVR